MSPVPAPGASPAPPSYRHLLRLSDSRGIFEHALLSRPRLECGYCTDDNARLALVAARGRPAQMGGKVLLRLGARFILDAMSPTGTVRNRMNCRGSWEDTHALEDAWGRSLWALGTIAVRSPEAWMRRESLAAFDRGARNRSEFVRANCFAALGAAEVVRAFPDHVPARALLAEVGSHTGSLVREGEWSWPEDRLKYSNAVMPETMIAAGVTMGDRALLDAGLGLLDWLWRAETLHGRLSVTPVGGRGPEDPKPSFDQQPIEVAALADACHRAFGVTGSEIWRRRVETCSAWFLGHNDSSTPMIDLRTGGGFDGLEPGGANLNQGAESTLAMVSTLQRSAEVARDSGVALGK